jgi:hypothetical protein
LLPAADDTPDYIELVEELCQRLTGKERRRWLLAIRDNRSNVEIAKMEGLKREVSYVLRSPCWNLKITPVRLAMAL